MIQKYSDAAVESCKECGKGPVRRLISSPAIQFKGTGWYVTDYAQKGKSDSAVGNVSQDRDTAKSDAAASDSTPAKTDSAKSDTRPRRYLEGVERLNSVSRYFRKGFGEIGPTHREVDQRLQKSQLVAGVVANTVDLVRIDWPRPQQMAQSVR